MGRSFNSFLRRQYGLSSGVESSARHRRKTLSTSCVNHFEKSFPKQTGVLGESFASNDGGAKGRIYASGEGKGLEPGREKFPANFTISLLPGSGQSLRTETCDRDGIRGVKEFAGTSNPFPATREAIDSERGARWPTPRPLVKHTNELLPLASDT
ncbi:hypothetical protein BaRGS_00016982 [Batillaria attramentaria]|uniref:Uncharacterized protein n=1 Tax=Batillaria attramentaria TaxID=370345 RepID=A0ABD0KWP6_9CAEN